MTAANALYYGDCLAVMEEMPAFGPISASSSPKSAPKRPISASFRPHSLAGHRSKWRQMMPLLKN